MKEKARLGMKMANKNPLSVLELVEIDPHFAYMEEKTF